ncbi:hypothetical protein C8J55DRAFT_567624 [Lentinula edodes]|uniref:RCC1/BLIP-II n=1 Tax=Lentinula lateritia TaxID=40482 RepID=A0A9W8ZQF2_9AGAR|nr:hypothetical protein C8J55DRAFT_567624 [Lentinula edodes]
MTAFPSLDTLLSLRSAPSSPDTSAYQPAGVVAPTLACLTVDEIGRNTEVLMLSMHQGPPYAISECTSATTCTRSAVTCYSITHAFAIAVDSDGHLRDVNPGDQWVIWNWFRRDRVEPHCVREELAVAVFDIEVGHFVGIQYRQCWLTSDITQNVPDPKNPGSFLNADELPSVPHLLRTLVVKSFRAVRSVLPSIIKAYLGYGALSGSTKGAGEQAQLGHKVPERRKIHGTVPQKVSLGTCTSFPVDDKGDIWGWGLNTMRQAGTGYASEDDSQVQLPTKVEGSSKKAFDGSMVIRSSRFLGANIIRRS